MPATTILHTNPTTIAARRCAIHKPPLRNRINSAYGALRCDGSEVMRAVNMVGQADPKIGRA